LQNDDRLEMVVSRGFVSAMIGIGMTLFAWYGPWAWPAWPAFTTIDLLFGHRGFADLPYVQRSAVLVALIVVNIGFWGAVAYGVIRGANRFGKRSES
jgi:hypothetical protein